MAGIAVSKNASFPITVRRELASNVTLDSELHAAKHDFSIVVTKNGMWTYVILAQMKTHSNLINGIISNQFLKRNCLAPSNKRTPLIFRRGNSKLLPGYRFQENDTSLKQPTKHSSPISLNLKGSSMCSIPDHKKQEDPSRSKEE